MSLWDDITPDLKDQYQRTALHICAWNVSMQDKSFVPIYLVPKGAKFVLRKFSKNNPLLV
jgi:hypothetical protein